MKWWVVVVAMLALVGTSGCGKGPAGTPSLVNPAGQDDESAEVRTEGRRVLELSDWKVKYAEQREKNRWRNSLSNEFHEWVRAHPTDEDIPPAFREEYQMAAREYGIQLNQIISRRHKTANGMEGIVEWNDGDFGRVQTSFYWNGCPSTVQVRLAQEDLWAYEAVLRAIAKTNDEVGATGYGNAAIKRIEKFAVGKPATLAMFAAKRGESDFGQYDYDEEYDDSEHELVRSAGKPIEEWIDDMMRTGRYVDMDGSPLAGDSRPYVELNLLPVYVEVVMNQRRLPSLLVHLADSHMPVDVKRVCIDGVEQEVSSASAGEAEQGEEDAGENPAVSVVIIGGIRIFTPPPVD